LTFVGDGSFLIANVPRDVLLSWNISNISGVPEGDPIDVEGTWLITGTRNSLGRPTIELTFPDPERDGDVVRDIAASGSGPELRLQVSLGDPDMSLYYTFQPAN
jgi:hypothetical protein